MAFPGGEFGGAGFGFPGVGGGVNLDVNGGGGFGIPGLGLGAGGFPGWTGFSGPYIPSTPLGALGGIKGDLIVPIVAVGVALFLLVLIVLAVKAALAWKLSLLSDVSGNRFRRDVGSAPAPHLEDDKMMEMARMVMSALYSDSCSKRVICDIGSYARSTKQLPAVLRLVESFMPADYIPSIEIMRNSAEGSLECERQFPCGASSTNDSNKNASQEQDQSGNKNAAQDPITNNHVEAQQPQKRHVPIPLQVTARPTLLEGIKINKNSSAANKSETNEVRPNVHKSAKLI